MILAIYFQPNALSDILRRFGVPRFVNRSGKLIIKIADRIFILIAQYLIEGHALNRRSTELFRNNKEM